MLRPRLLPHLRSPVFSERGVRVKRVGPVLEASVPFGRGDGDRPFTLSLDGVSLGRLPVPGPLVDWVGRHFDPTLSINVASGRILIGEQ
jgi:hypothetical protein